MSKTSASDDGADRGKVGYVDVILLMASFVAFASISDFFFTIVGMIQSEADPLTSVLAGLIVPLLLIGLLYSVGVSARS